MGGLVIGAGPVSIRDAVAVPRGGVEVSLGAAAAVRLDALALGSEEAAESPVASGIGPLC